APSQPFRWTSARHGIRLRWPSRRCPWRGLVERSIALVTPRLDSVSSYILHSIHEDIMRKITPFLWYNGQIKEALDLYTSVFPNSKVIGTAPGPGGALMSATLEIEGQQVILFNGGPSHQL